MEKGEKKRGQIDLSFGFIFGIILIIVTIFVVFLVIHSFLNIGCSANSGLMYDDIKTEITNAWSASGITQKPLSETAPGGITAVCFGSFNNSLTNTLSSDSKNAYQSLRPKYENKDKNVFLYPSEKACSSALASYKLDHVKIPQFFCAFVKDGKIAIRLNKSITDPLVTLTK